MKPFEAFVVAAPGLEPLVAGELEQLGVSGAEVVDGGVEFSASLRTLYEANLRLRTASRVLVRLAKFRAVSFAELERGARKVPWERVIATGDGVLLRVTCRKSRLYHSDAVAERLARDIAGRIGATATTSAREAAEDDPGGAQLVVVRIDRNVCTVSADSSGAHLHRRGYRTAVTEAPLRETLAAALVLASGWDRRSPLLDPFCGSGTIPIEAAMMAARVAPGAARRFRFMAWPGFDGKLWSGLLASARGAEERGAAVDIGGSDRSAAAVRAATGNARRAGVERLVRLGRGDALQLEPGFTGPGWVVSNLPYGVRLGDAAESRRLLKSLTGTIRRRLAGWHLAFLVPAGVSGRDTGLALESVLRTVNGGLDVHVLRGVVPRAD